MLPEPLMGVCHLASGERPEIINRDRSLKHFLKAFDRVYIPPLEPVKISEVEPCSDKKLRLKFALRDGPLEIIFCQSIVPFISKPAASVNECVTEDPVRGNRFIVHDETEVPEFEVRFSRQVAANTKIMQ